MKKITTTEFSQNYTKHMKRIPEEGFLVERLGKVVAHVTRPDKEMIDNEIVEEAVESIREIDKKIQIDTFTEIDYKKSSSLGQCSRCGRFGDVVRRSYRRENGVNRVGNLCTTRCHRGAKKSLGKLPKKSVKKEVRFNNGKKDFGGSNEISTF